MAFPEYPFPPSTKPFPEREDVLKYLQSYAQRFNLNQHAKFEHFVNHVEPIARGKWEITVTDLPNNKTETVIYDAVIVANGHNSKPWIPKYEGADYFTGQMIHSHVYRDAKNYQGKCQESIRSCYSG